MDYMMRLRPGIPDDENRDYLPEKLKYSNYVVNENGNNSQPYPENLKEFKQVLVNGVEDVWYEYVPNSYDSSTKTPLVLSMHGGLMTGWGQAVYTSWTMVADRDNVIVVFPNAHSKRMWTLEATQEEQDASKSMPSEIRMNYSNATKEENHDIKYIFDLIDVLKEKYNMEIRW